MRKLKKIQIAKICIMSMAVSAFAGVSTGMWLMLTPGLI